MREMENVDICIEWVRIREFDSSGGRIELFKRTFSFVLEFVYIPFMQSGASKAIRLHWFNSVIPVPPPAEGILIPCSSVPSVVHPFHSVIFLFLSPG